MKQLSLICLIFSLSFLTACKEEQGTDAAGVTLKEGSYTVIIETQSGQSHAFSVELALTPEQQSQGLMNRTQLDDDKGMLFYFNEAREQSFWMKNTLIPLDMLFIKQSGRIHHIHENAIPHDLTPVKSMGEVVGVLEINGGLSRKLGIQPGDTIKHPFFSQNYAQ